MNYSNPYVVDAQQTRLEKNYEAFQSLVAKSSGYLSRGQYQHSAVFAEIAAYHATWKHNGLFASYELEEILRSLAKQAVQPAKPSSLRNGSNCSRVLHITSMVSGLAGLQHLLQRWIGNDGSRCHSVAVSQPSWSPVPEKLKGVVTASGGTIELVGDTCLGILARAQRIRTLATESDLIVLHLQTEDVAPIIALSQTTGIPPVALVNHADHAFWIGASFVDLIANLRDSGLVLCRDRRGIDPERLVLLPTPLDPIVRTLSREDAKRRLGLPINSVVLLSVARAPKYTSKDGLNFALTHVPVLQKYQESFLLVVGPEHSDDWERANEKTGGRIKAFGTRADVALFFQAADIYVDAFPMVSVTSLLEAGSFGLPLVSRCPHSKRSVIWCADSPGLEHMIRCRNIDDYRDKLCCLVQDAKLRIELGRNTQELITRIHGGEKWIESLEMFYARAKMISKQPAVSFPRSQRNISEPDLLMPQLLSDGKELVDVFFRYREVLPIDWSMVTFLLLRPKVLARILLARLVTRLPFERRIKQMALRFAQYVSGISHKPH